MPVMIPRKYLKWLDALGYFGVLAIIVVVYLMFVDV